MHKYTEIPKQFIIAINEQEQPIKDYKYSIGRAYNDYFSQHINGVQLSGRSKSKCCGELRLALLNSYVEIMSDFLLPGPYRVIPGGQDPLDSFPLSLEEMRHIEYGINSICDTNYSIFQYLDSIMYPGKMFDTSIEEVTPPYVIDPEEEKTCGWPYLRDTSALSGQVVYFGDTNPYDATIMYCCSYNGSQYNGYEVYDKSSGITFMNPGNYTIRAYCTYPGYLDSRVSDNQLTVNAQAVQKKQARTVNSPIVFSYPNSVTKQEIIADTKSISATVTTTSDDEYTVDVYISEQSIESALSNGFDTRGNNFWSTNISGALRNTHNDLDLGSYQSVECQFNVAAAVITKPNAIAVGTSKMYLIDSQFNPTEYNLSSQGITGGNFLIIHHVDRYYLIDTINGGVYYFTKDEIANPWGKLNTSTTRFDGAAQHVNFNGTDSTDSSSVFAGASILWTKNRNANNQYACLIIKKDHSTVWYYDPPSSNIPLGAKLNKVRSIGGNLFLLYSNGSLAIINGTTYTRKEIRISNTLLTEIIKYLNGTYIVFYENGSSSDTFKYSADPFSDDWAQGRCNEDAKFPSLGLIVYDISEYSDMLIYCIGVKTDKLDATTTVAHLYGFSSSKSTYNFVTIKDYDYKYSTYRQNICSLSGSASLVPMFAYGTSIYEPYNKNSPVYAGETDLYSVASTYHLKY